MAVTRPAEADAAESVGRRWTSVQAMPGVTVLRVACEHIAGAVVLRCAGSVDASNADELRTAIESTVSAVVVVELGGLDRFDSEGVQALEQAFRGRRSSPGRSTDPGCGAVADRVATAVAGERSCPARAASSTSCAVTRPPAPEPTTARGSTPSSCASRRTAGDRNPVGAVSGSGMEPPNVKRTLHR